MVFSSTFLNFKLKLLENIKLLCAVAVMEPIQLQEDQARLFWEQMLIYESEPTHSAPLLELETI